jgi:thiamine biosynthesis protein ThiS
MGLTVAINGQSRSFEELEPRAALASLIGALSLKGDRIAVERNGEIVERARWMETTVESGDRLEIVHFVGGGSWGLTGNQGS